MQPRFSRPQLKRFQPINPEHVWFAGYFLIIALTYLGMQGIFRVENIDDAWSLSFIYNFLFKHVSYDLTFGATTGGCGVQFFGKTFAFVYGPILNLIGWTKNNALMLSTFFIATAAFIWYQILVGLGNTRKFALAFAGLMLWIEPFFQAAHEGRSDALIFFMVTLTIWLFCHRKWFWVGLCTGVAFEIHPLGIMAFIYCCGLAWAQWPQLKTSFSIPKIIGLLSGLVVGAGYFIWLHWTSFGGLLHDMQLSNGSAHNVINNYLWDYFSMFMFIRHLPELLIIVGCLLWFIKAKMYRENRYIGILLLVLLASTLVIRRSNYRYMIYIYPVFLWLILEVFQRLKRLHWAVWFFLILLIPQYGYTIIQNRQVHPDSYMSEMKQLIPANSLPVVGSPNAWFVFKEREFYPFNYIGGFRSLHIREFYAIENQDFFHGEYPYMQNVFAANYNLLKQRSVMVDGEKMLIGHYRIKDTISRKWTKAR